METIKSYLEAMFANMPNTAEVKKAKAELLQMMEDKYNEMISDGISENEAVGTVISEFGNLDELAEDLGLTKEVEEVHERQQERPARYVSMDEIQDFLRSSANSALRIAIGVFLCITCVIYPILWDSFGNGNDEYGAAGMFISIAIGVGLFVLSGVLGRDWEFLKKEPCRIDMATADYIKNRRNGFKTTRAIALTVGVMLCVSCVIPCMLNDLDVMPVFMFLSIGIGVLLIVYVSIIQGSFETALKINDEKTISGTYNDTQKHYTNKTVKAVMSVYWSTVTCLYLITSFLTFSWYRTWIIWPIAAIVKKIIDVAFVQEDEQ